MSGKLVIVSTPIGNLGDMPPRALEALQAADVVCAEDTRVTGKLLASFGIKEKRLERLDENVIGERAASVVDRVLKGETIAYCTDAGMPGISDPGLRLVAAAHQANVDVEVIPGPSAALVAYVSSGTTCPRFYFGGFFPRKDNARREALRQLASLDASLIFYESPNRLLDALRIIAESFPLRTIAVCRELTKLHEEVVRGIAPDVAQTFNERGTVKGEIVIVIDPTSSDESEQVHECALQAARTRARELYEAGEYPKSIAAMLVDEFSLSRNDAYDLVLSLKEE